MTIVSQESESAAESVPLHASINVDVPGRCLNISVDIPLSAGGLSVVIHGFTVRGHAASGIAVPLVIPLLHGMEANTRMRCGDGCYSVPRSFCISAYGHLFVPKAYSHEVLLFGVSGAPLPGLSIEGLGDTSSNVRWAAFADGVHPTLLLADNSDESKLVALDPSTRAVRWVASPSSQFGPCGGLAALPSHGVVLAASVCDSAIFARSLVDGSVMGSVTVPNLSNCIAADPRSGAIFGNVRQKGGVCSIARFSWTPGSGLRASGILTSEGGQKGQWRPLAVVPPWPEKCVSHLVVGAWNAPELLVFALPSLDLVHVHELRGMQVIGLAADPWGQVLAVSDYDSKAICALAWPLPGMQALH